MASSKFRNIKLPKIYIVWEILHFLLRSGSHICKTRQPQNKSVFTGTVSLTKEAAIRTWSGNRNFNLVLVWGAALGGPDVVPK